MKSKLIYLYIIVVLHVVRITSYAQLSSTSFESFADEHQFTLASWTSEGFSVPWVNGFNQSRAYVDNAYAVTGTKSLRILYPANNFGTSNTGAQAPLLVTPSSQYYISYWVRFSDNFSWGTTSEGGKLPGLGGGLRCSGCNVCTGSNGFTARLMWRNSGRLVLYLYHMEADKSNPPCGDNNTLQVGGSDYYAPKGQWIKITQRVKVNTSTNHDGEVELWINEQPALLRTGIQFVSNGDQVDNLYFSTFHGGATAAWAPTVDSYAWFDDIKISTNPSDIFDALGLNFSESNYHTNEFSRQTIISPQPLKKGEQFSINHFYSESLSLKIEWTDLRGKTIYTTYLDKFDNIEVPDLQEGTYLLRLYAPDKILHEKAIIF